MEIISVPKTKSTYRVGSIVFRINEDGRLAMLELKASHPHSPMSVEHEVIVNSMNIQDPMTKDYYLLSVENGKPVLTLLEG